MNPTTAGKTSRARRHTTALTLVEAVVMVFLLAGLVVMFLPALMSHHSGVQHIYCVNNLKQVGLSFQIWASDHNNKYPMAMSVTNGGTQELITGPDAWKTYLAMSNEISSPKILLCPQDAERKRAATNFSDDLKLHISYFVGLDATVDNPNALLSGDDNFLINGLPVRSGVIEMTSNSPIAWNSSRHVWVKTRFGVFSTKTSFGYIGLGDGIVQPIKNSDLLNQVHQTGLATNRLTIP